jgi:tetratricopeptide (TPR) repeat protein
MKKYFLVAEFIFVAFTAFAQSGMPSIEDLTRKIEREPTAQNFFDRGFAYGAFGMPQESIEDYGRAIALDPLNVEVYLYRAKMFLAIGDIQRGLADCDKAIEIDPLSSDGYSTRGLFLFLAEREDDALASVNKALSLDGKNSEALCWRGVIYTHAFERYEDAIADFDKAIEIDPQDSVYDGRAEAYYRMGKYKEAISDLTKEIELVPDYADAYVGRAQSYQSLAAQTNNVRQKAEYERLAEEDFKMAEKLTGTRN